jgi:hypothetical protein
MGTQAELEYTPAQPIGILKFAIEGYKRVRNITISPATAGLTKIGGKNKQGKTSCLDALAHALFGPDAIARNTNTINTDAPEIPGARRARSRMRVEFDDGTVVERRLSDANSRSGILEVKLPSGQDGSLEDIKRFVSKFAICPPDINAMTERERTKWFLAALGIDLSDLEAKLAQITAERQELYVLKEKAQKHANDLPGHDGLPPEEVAASDIMDALQKALEANAANASKRTEYAKLVAISDRKADAAKAKAVRVSELEAQLRQAIQDLDAAKSELRDATDAVAGAKASIEGLTPDIPTSELREKLTDIDALNRKIRENKTKALKIAEADDYRKQWTAKDRETVATMKAMAARIEAANCPLPYLGIDENLCVTFDGQPWANMSGMQRKIFAAAVSSLYSPHARFVFADGLESLDDEMQTAFHDWAVGRNLQIVATEVTNNYDGEAGDDGITRLIISDGMVQEQKQ